MLLLLGGYEIPSGIPAVGTAPLNQRVCEHLNHTNFVKTMPCSKKVFLFSSLA